MSELSVEQVFDEAGQILSQPGAWMQGQYCNGATQDQPPWSDAALRRSSAYCSLGAIREVYRRHQAGSVGRDLHPLLGDQSEAVKVLRQLIPVPGINVHEWNDAADRTQAEVVEMFEKARAFAAEQGI